jgi:outer membrane protein OmpA-like peptidoglycan-associated protein
MNAIAGRAALAGLAAACVVLQGCPSAYQRTYEQQTQRLEMQRQAAQAEAEAAHAQAQKYAAVIYFAVGSSVISDDGQRELRWFVQQMQPFPQAVIQVQGFADSTGAEASNQGLSQARADAVASYLNSQGIAPPRLVVQGFGEQYAAASNETAKGRRNNRRVEVTVR